jgi:cytochrome c2
MEDKEMKIKYTFIVVLVIATIALVGCRSAAEPTPHPGQALVATKCSTCHSIVQVDNAKYSREMWDSTVNRMVMAGMQITDEQKAQVIDYLAIRDSE